jgi:predicted 3-demethylubiquinone-9 3-methyltransferase (glyoxalase superfamily)
MMETPANSATQRVTPFLWFADRAEEAVKFYMSIFKDAQIVSMNRLPAEAPGKEGRMIMATIRIKGLELMILEAGPMFEFTPAISLFVHCAEQGEVDFLWDKFLSNGGKPSQCGWLVDKYGLSWQIVPDALGRLMGDPNPLKARAVQQAMMKMIKLDSAVLQAAYDAV